MDFKRFYEAVDIFGFEGGRNAVEDEAHKELENYPIRQFDVELMMKLLVRKKLGLHEADYSGFMNEISWGGERPGAMSLKVDTGYTFHIRRLNYDLEGNKRWATKKLFQLNRRGLAGYEDIIANEIYETIEKLNQNEIDHPKPKFENLEKLTHKVSQAMRRVSNPIFIFRGIKKLSETCYHVVFECRAGGVEAQDQQTVDANVTQISFDETTGTVRINNYNLESGTGRERKFEIMPDDINMYFFPTQPMEEICDCIAVHFKYY